VFSAISIWGDYNISVLLLAVCSVGGFWFVACARDGPCLLLPRPWRARSFPCGWATLVRWARVCSGFWCPRIVAKLAAGPLFGLSRVSCV